jgi:hypothetical protein
MLITKKYIFTYDETEPAWKNHTKYVEHSGQTCTATFFDEEPATLELVSVAFEDGFRANVYGYELEEVK